MLEYGACGGNMDNLAERKYIIEREYKCLLDKIDTNYSRELYEHSLMQISYEIIKRWCMMIKWIFTDHLSEPFSTWTIFNNAKYNERVYKVFSNPYIETYKQIISEMKGYAFNMHMDNPNNIVAKALSDALEKPNPEIDNLLDLTNELRSKMEKNNKGENYGK